MKPDELHLADEHQFPRVLVIIPSTQIDETVHLLQFLFPIGRHTNLRDARYRNVIRRLDDTVALILGDNTYGGFFRTRLPNIFRHKLEHKGVTFVERRIDFDRKIKAVHRRVRNQQQICPIIPYIRRISC